MDTLLLGPRVFEIDWLLIILYGVIIVFFIYVTIPILSRLKLQQNLDSKYTYPKYNNRGKFINIDTTVKLPPPQAKDCSYKNLVKCKISNNFLDCLVCKNKNVTCQHFDTDVPILDIDYNLKNTSFESEILISHLQKTDSFIPKNESPDEGWCLQISNPKLIDRNSCSSKHGGRRVLIRINSDSIYAYVCICLNTEIFTQYSLFSNCTLFTGCATNSFITNADDPSSWDNFDDITCNCESGYKFKKWSQGGPACNPVKYFESDIDPVIYDEDIEMLDHKYISKEFLRNFTQPDLRKIPNPCKIDALTGKSIRSNFVHGKLKNNIYQCHSTSYMYKTIKYPSDYLLNNNGRRSNAIVKVVKDNSDDYQDAPQVIEIPIIDGEFTINTAPPFIGHVYEKFSIFDYIVDELQFIKHRVYPFQTSEPYSKYTALVFIYNNQYDDDERSASKCNTWTFQHFVLKESWTNKCLFYHICPKESLIERISVYNIIYIDRVRPSLNTWINHAGKSKYPDEYYMSLETFSERHIQNIFSQSLEANYVCYDYRNEFAFNPCANYISGILYRVNNNVTIVALSERIQEKYVNYVRAKYPRPCSIIEQYSIYSNMEGDGYNRKIYRDKEPCYPRSMELNGSYRGLLHDNFHSFLPKDSNLYTDYENETEEDVIILKPNIIKLED